MTIMTTVKDGTNVGYNDDSKEAMLDIEKDDSNSNIGSETNHTHKNNSVAESNIEDRIHSNSNVVGDLVPMMIRVREMKTRRLENTENGKDNQ